MGCSPLRNCRDCLLWSARKQFGQGGGTWAHVPGMYLAPTRNDAHRRGYDRSTSRPRYGTLLVVSYNSTGSTPWLNLREWAPAPFQSRHAMLAWILEAFYGGGGSRVPCSTPPLLLPALPYLKMWCVVCGGDTAPHGSYLFQAQSTPPSASRGSLLLIPSMATQLLSLE